MRQKAHLHSVSLLLALAAASPFVLPSAAMAKEPSASELQIVKEMLKDVVADEKAGKCADAIAILKQAAAIKETPEVLFYMGECQVKMGHLREGLTSLERSLEAARQEKDNHMQQVAASRIEQVKARVPTVTLHMPADVKAPAVRIDDEQIAADRLSAPIQVDPGDHTVSVTADGRKPFSQKISVAEKDAPQIEVDIPLLGQASSSASDDGTPKDGGTPSDDTGKARGVPLGTWIAGGAAVALTLGGVIAFVAAGSAASDGASQCSTQKTCDQSSIDSVHRLDTAALALWVGAGIGAGVAVAIYVLEKPKDKARPPPTSGRVREAPRPSARVVVGPASLGVVGAF